MRAVRFYPRPPGSQRLFHLDPALNLGRPDAIYRGPAGVAVGNAPVTSITKLDSGRIAHPVVKASMTRAGRDNE